MTKLRGIIIIVIDALRYESFKRAMDLRLLRCLKYLSLKGISFDKAYSLTNTTDPSLVTILTGLHPLEHGIINHGFRISSWEYAKAHRLISLPRILGRKGWFTASVDFLERWYPKWFSIYSSVHDPLLLSQLGRALLVMGDAIRKGFDGTIKLLRFIRTKSNPIALTNLFRDPSIVTNIALRYIKYALCKKEKFFIVIHYWASHVPYYAPEKLFKQLLGIKSKLLPPGVQDKPLNEILKSLGNPYWRGYLETWFTKANLAKTSDVITSYYAAFLAIDREIGKIIEFLNYNGLLDETIIIITADHGESLGEHGIYFDHHGLYEVSLHVPLIFYFEPIGQEKAKGTALHTDIAPTLLDLTKVVHKQDFSYNLLDLLDEDLRQNTPLIFLETFTEVKLGIRIGNYKFIKALNTRDAICRYCFKIHGGIYELYNLKEDPNETTNLAFINKSLVNYFEKRFMRTYLKFKMAILRSRNLNQTKAKHCKSTYL